MQVLLRAFLTGSLMLLAACGGGGGAGGPAVVTPPPPPPPPAPPPSVFDTDEFRANWGLDAVNALAAYDDGLSGAGIVIGVLDTGIDLDQTELDDNIHPASKDIFDGTNNALTTRGGAPGTFNSLRAGGASLDDIDGHGTFVAGLIAAEKNDIRSHGLAFNAQILAVRTDDSASCPADCLFDDNAIAASLNYAVANGADVVNISLGGSSANSFLEGAIKDAAAAGVIIVISAGNAPETTAPFSPDPDADPLALAALETWASGQVIIAGSSTSLGTISDFSNRAGIGAPFYLLAPGEGVFSTAVDPGTGDTTFGTGSGTSFAAPAVAAAAGLLMEKFPALTAAEVVDILLTSATDVGAFGVDAINGHGLLNVEAAIAPIGVTSLSIKTLSGIVTSDPGDGGLVAGGLFGDGFGLGFQGGAIFTDVYDRAYVTEFGDRIMLANPFVNFPGRFEAAESYETARLDLGAGSTLSLSGRYDQPLTNYEENTLGVSSRSDDTLDDVTFRIETKLDTRTSMSFGQGGTLDAALDGTGEHTMQGASLAQGTRLPWLSGTAAASADGSVMTGGRRMSVAHRFDNGVVLSAAAGEDDVAAPATQLLSREPTRDASRASTALRLGKAERAGEWAMTLGRVEETGAVLGSFSAGVLALGRGSQADFLGLSGKARLGQAGYGSLSLFGHLAGASISIDEAAGSAFSHYQGLMASQVAVGLALDGVEFGGHRVSLTLSQPLRLEAGGAVYGFASGYDYDSDTALFDDTLRSLTPSGRELDVELAWHLGVNGAARFSANLLYQHEPGHVAGRDDAVSVMFTGRRSF